MTVERMIELLEIEKECVLRNASGECNRYCAGCDLLQDDTELHEMYTEAIDMLKAQEPRVIIDEELMDRIRKAPIVQIPAADAVLIQEPRVMTLEEIGNALKMPLWKETKRVHKDLYTGWVLAYDIQKGLGITGTRLGMSEPSGRVVWYGLDDYGKTWRCWTSEPTEEQREAAPWN